jgi:hypothetical protein
MKNCIFLKYHYGAPLPYTLDGWGQKYTLLEVMALALGVLPWIKMVVNLTMLFIVPYYN